MRFSFSKKVSFFFKFVFVLLLPVSLFAQENSDYSIRLNARTFTPPANIEDLTKESEIFKNTFFIDKHYLLIQFKQLPKQERKEALLANGIELKEYIPNNAYTVSVSKSADLSLLKDPNIRAVFRFEIQDKMSNDVLEEKIPAHAIRNNAVDVTVITYEKLAKEQIKSSLDNIGASIVDDQSIFNSYVIRVPQSNIKKLAELSYIQWIEFVPPPDELENTLGRSLHRVNELNDGIRNLKGDSVNVGIWDGGEVGDHIDFFPSGRVTLVETSSASTHSTHCAGTITGRGNLNPNARGMAPNAALYSYNFSGNIQTEMAVGIPANNLIVSSHSYGGGASCGLTGSSVAYSTRSRETDLNLNNFPTHIHCHSAGNSQSSCSGGWSTITGSGKSAKNNILVAALSTSDVLASFSSCGPVHDGRIKPDISGFGSSVFSTYPNNTYSTISGTSMSTPGIAGSATLLVQRYKQLNANTPPPSSLIKNIILNTAQDLGNAGPDYRYGYGRINALEAARILEDNRYEVNTITTSGVNNKTITVPAGASSLRVMLTWNDPAGAANASVALVNNLDLSVINGSTTTLPWKLDANNPGTLAFRGIDAVNNVEQVTLDNPTAGTYTLRVSGLSVPTGPAQEYTLSWWVEAPGIEIIYPNGGEEFDPGSSETIRWNNAGVTANQTVQYSLNGGTTWTTLSSSVSPSTLQYVWNPPAAANTSNALVRITSGAFSDQSNAAFSVLNTPDNFSGASGSFCNAGEVDFTWSNVSNATHYDIYVLNTTSGYYDTLATNIVGTTYTGTGLPASTSMWFYIQAKNNTTGAKSKRSVAINVTTSGTGGSASTPGNISGSISICAPSNGQSYSINTVSGASGYTWTAPAGSFITSGQGTTNITINFTTAATSGNLTVTATDGSCTSLPSTLPITINQSTPPTTSNDTVCINNAATLAASGSGTLKWYDNPTGGNLINTGTNYTTPPLTTNTTYYVSNVFVAPNQTMGKADNTGGGAFFDFDRHLKFDAYVDMEIISAVVYAGAAGDRTFELRDNNGTPLQSTTINLVSGMQTVNLNFAVSAGTDYQIGVSSTTANIDMYRNNNGLSYPYNLAGIGSITRSDASTNGGLNHYYFLYDWTVKASDCESGRTPVTAAIGSPPVAPTVATADPACTGSTGTISITNPLASNLEYSINGTNYQSSPTFSAVAGTYSVSARITGTTCVSASTSATLNASTVPCAGGTPNISTGAQNPTPSIAVGGNTTINYRVNNTGSGPTTGAPIEIFISKPTNGTLVVSPPAGWTIVTDNAAFVQLTSNNIIQPGLTNAAILPAVYTHDNTSQNALKTSGVLATPGSGGETITNDNDTGTFIQVN